MRPSFFALVPFVLSLVADAAAQTAAAIAYAPTVGACPSGTTLVRQVGHNASAQTLSQSEHDYITARRSQVLPDAWLAYLTNLKTLPSLTLPVYVDAILQGKLGKDKLPKLGIATSGGGHRAAIFGAGILNALDGRNATSVDAGTGGLLQTATYLAGLSGGSWLVGSLAQNNFPTIQDLVFGSSTTTGWNTQLDLLSPSDNATLNSEFVSSLFGELAVKYYEGFPVTIGDIWARALSHHFINGSTAANMLDSSLTHGAGVTLSSVSGLSSFTSHKQPFPIVLANSFTSKDSSSQYVFPDQYVPLENPIYEFNVYETGSWDPALGAFTPTKYLGSPNSSVCVTGYDQLSFIEGVSSNLFTEYNVSGVDITTTAIGSIIEGLEYYYPEGPIQLDTSIIPNPFRGVSSDTYPDSDQAYLTLVDGGLDGEVTPYQPLLVKARGVDTIVAIDGVADTTSNWAAGLSMIATQQRVKMFNTTYSFPSVPTNSSTFVDQGLTVRPTFFGCEEPSTSDAPLVVYIANGGAPLGETAVLNTPTSQTEYPLAEVQSMIDQAFDTATQGIPTTIGGTQVKDPLWPACLACAVVDRARRDLGLSRSGVCKSCLKKYCWS